MGTKILLVLCTLVGVLPSIAFADWQEFIPRPVENGAYVDTYSSYERDHWDSGTQPVRWNDTFIREKLTLFSNGYSYHPRFVQYRFSISGALKQEDYETSYASGGQGWRTGDGFEYDTRLVFLPEHSYNLMVFASRYEPVLKEQAASQHNSIAETEGVTFRYRKKPYFAHLGYIDNHVDSGDTSSDVQRLTANGEYFKRFPGGNEVSVTGAINPSWFSNSTGLDGNSTEYLLGNLVNLQRVRLTSNFTQQYWDQTGPSSEKFENDQLVWYELLSAYLPYNFRGDVSYRYQNNDNKSRYPSLGIDQDLSDTSNDVRLNVNHRLYESLDTIYTLLYDDRSTTGGDTTTLSNSLGFNYTKLIPKGRLLAGTSVARAETDNSGQANIVDEPYSGIPVPPGTFTLRQQYVEESSISVSMKSPLPPFEIIPLVENVNYLVVPDVNTFEIRVYALPENFAPGVYDFLVSYSLATGNYTLRTDSYAGNVRFEMFDNLLTPYFNVVAIRSDVLSGVFPGQPVDSTTYTTGLLYLYGPWRARGEYQELDWDVTPSQSWRAEVQYVGAVNPTTTLYVTTSYLNKHYGQGTSTFYGLEPAYTEQTVSSTGSIQKQLPARNLYLSVGGSYSHMEGLVNNDAYAANTSVVWKVGKLDVSLGATWYGSNTSGENIVSSERDHQLVFLKMRRRLF